MTKTSIRMAALAAALLLGAATALPGATPAHAATAPTHAATKTMAKTHHVAKKHMGSPAVKSAQEALNKSGAKLAEDGKWGPKTKAALKSFQHAHGLKATGTLDGATKKALGVG